MSRSLEPEFVGRTYDDFLFRPRRGIVGSRRDIRLRSPLTAGASDLYLELPVVSSNMDSVTGVEMARAMALEGGLGFLHRAMRISEQAAAVRAVKRTHGFVVEEPVRIARDATLEQAREAMRDQRVSVLVETAPGSGILAGLITARDVPWFESAGDRPVSEMMTPIEELVTASPDVSPEAAERLLYRHRVEKLPLVDEDNRICGLITKRDMILHRKRPHVTKDDKGRLRVGAAIGATGDFLERAGAVIEAGVDVLMIDIAHGHSDVMEAAVEAFRNAHGEEMPLVCGNVGTAEGARLLADLGADAVKVGIGPGRGCRTRLETAAGVPQLQAVREVWCELGEEVPIIADGGISDDKDIFLALVCGASSVMLGSALSGTDEAPGTVIVDPVSGQKTKIYRGMTSPQAVLEALYEPTQGAPDEEAVEEALATPPEGQELRVPYRGTVVDILHRVRGHLRSAVSYAGADSLAGARREIVAEPLEHLVPLSDSARRESYER